MEGIGTEKEESRKKENNRGNDIYNGGDSKLLNPVEPLKDAIGM